MKNFNAADFFVQVVLERRRLQNQHEPDEPEQRVPVVWTDEDLAELNKNDDKSVRSEVPGTASRGWAWSGMARQGMAGRALVGLGMARLG